MATLSVVLSVYNGATYLAEALASVKEIADEIILVDHNSTDKTVAIAKKFTKNIFKIPNDPENIDLQKNFGFEKASGDWIFSLDADERLTPALQQEIRGLLLKKDAKDAYYVPRQNIIFGKIIKHTGWSPDYQLRLFRKGKGKYTKKHVHESITITGTTDKLSSPIIHHAYQSVHQFIHRGLTVYAPNEADSILSSGYVFSYIDILRFPFQEFLSRFFAREGYRDGFHGLALSLLMACYHVAIFLYIWEKKDFPDDVDVEKLLPEEIKRVQSDWKYWMTSMKIHESNNPASKLLLRAKRKLHV